MSLKDSIKSLLPASVKKALFERRLAALAEERKAFIQKNPGDAYSCNLCGKSAGAFMPDGESHAVLKELKVLSGGIRENCRCPHCYSKDRDRLIWFFLNRKTNLMKDSNGKALLHFAPEPELKKALSAVSHLIYIDADLNPMLAGHQMDITAIPLPENSQDAVLCNHVLEHIPDDSLAMRELYRVLKPGGFAVLQVPISLSQQATVEDPEVTSPKERERRFGQRDHVRIYGKDYTQRLRKAGFTVQEVEPIDFLSPDEIQRFGILKEETVYYCTKS